MAASFALVRYTLAQNRSVTDRFVSFLEASVRRQEEANTRLGEALDRVASGVRENSVLLSRLADRSTGQRGAR